MGAALGIHPNDNSLDQFDHLLNKAQHQKVVAIGETGLDYFQDSNDTAIQREYFRTHIRIAKQLKKPLIIHTRAAKKDTLAILHEENAAVIGGVFQCFNEDWETAKKAMDMNFYISFSGLISHLNNETLNRIAKSVPIDRILIETDSPFFAPSPFHETQNEPAFLPNIAAYLANLRDESLEEFANAVTTNFFHLFQKAKKPK